MSDLVGDLIAAMTAEADDQVTITSNRDGLLIVWSGMRDGKRVTLSRIEPISEHLPRRLQLMARELQQAGVFK